MNKKISPFIIFLLCPFIWQHALSSDSSGIPDSEPDLGEFVPGEKWKEGKVEIPPFPNDENLIRVEMERNLTPFQYYLDQESLSIGKDDVIRYTVVIKSDSGAKNVMFEGIRCSTREYRTYAYGSSGEDMSASIISEWKLFYDSETMIHRYNFYYYYMCDRSTLTPFKKEEMLRRIHYPEDFNQDGDRGD